MFVYNIGNNSDHTILAQNAVRKAKLFKHPGVLGLLDSQEVETHMQSLIQII